MAKVNGHGKPQAAAAAPVAPAVDPALLERAAEETARMGRSDRVFHWDKRQGAKIWANADGRALTPAELEVDERATAITAIADFGTRPALHRHHLITAPSVLLCGNDKAHGPLIINGAGSNLLCGAHKNGAACTYNQPVSL